MTLITKHRPKQFKDMIGQDAAVRSLARSLKAGDSRTFLLTGPSGVGKTTLARIAAGMVGAVGMDLYEVDAATHTGIDDMRTVMESMLTSPFGKAKAAIIDEAHALSAQALKSLLKIFEEPPPYGYWFMCTTEPAKIPKTLQTRCHSVHLKEVSVDALCDFIRDIARLEKAKTSEDIITLCANAAEGSPRQALAYFGAARDAKSVTEARELMATAHEDPKAYDLAKLLFNPAKGWRDCQALLREMKDLNGEGVRLVVQAYMVSCALSIPSGQKLQQALAVLEEFSQPCYSTEKIAPIVVRCARLYHGD